MAPFPCSGQCLLLLLPYNRYILSSHSLIKLPFHRPAHTIDFATTPFKQMCCFPLLLHKAGSSDTPNPSHLAAGSGAGSASAPPWGTASLGTSSCSTKPKPPRIHFSSEETRARGIFFFFFKAATPGFYLFSEVVHQTTPQQIKLKGPWPLKTSREPQEQNGSYTRVAFKADFSLV